VRYRGDTEIAASPESVIIRIIGRNIQLKLTQHEIQQAMEKAKAAFPNFTDWEHGDETDNDHMHMGFTLWGEYTPDPEALPSKHFFVTFDTYEDAWSGNLSIGKHCYF